jgi:hypothetical protein
MSSDVLARLAAANPIPDGTSVHAPEPFRIPHRRLALTLGLATAVSVPAVAFAGKLGNLLGISNSGTTVSTNAVLPEQTNLDQAMQQLKVGGTMQYLGTLNGAAFYATRNADGHFCIAIDHVDPQYDKGFGCDLNADGFPSPDHQVLAFPAVHALQGVAADGVATVELLGASGTVIAAAPVTNNLFESDLPPSAQPAFIVTLDAEGNVTSKHPFPPPNLARSQRIGD